VLRIAVAQDVVAQDAVGEKEHAVEAERAERASV